jgi:hypothetical protein
MFKDCFIELRSGWLLEYLYHQVNLPYKMPQIVLKRKRFQNI